MRLLLALAVALLRSSYTQACSAKDHVGDCSALTDLLAANPPLATVANWKLGTSFCGWAGINCNSDGRVTYLVLPNAGLVGVLSPAFILLTELQILYLPGNKLSGAIPSLISLPELQYLDLSNNEFTSGIPNANPKLQAIYMINNKLTGGIPEMAGMPALKTLKLSNNQLTNMPSTIGANQALLEIDWSNNQLTGAIPASIVALTNLESLILSDNMGLNGQIPVLINSMTALRTLVLSKTGLSGYLPDSIGLLPNLRQFFAGQTQLTIWNPLSPLCVGPLLKESIAPSACDLSLVNFKCPIAPCFALCKAICIPS